MVGDDDDVVVFLKGSDGDESHSAAPHKPPELKSHQKSLGLGLGDGESMCCLIQPAPEVKSHQRRDPSVPPLELLHKIQCEEISTTIKTI